MKEQLKNAIQENLKNNIMFHLTLTGFYAGHPICNKNKIDLLEDKKINNKFVHYGYFNRSDQEIIESDDICPECRKMILDILNDE